MLKITPKQRKQLILKTFLENKEYFSVSDLFKNFQELNIDISLISIKRDLSELTAKGFINKKGEGRSVRYAITTKGRILFDIDITTYVEKNLSKSLSLRSYNFDLFKDIDFEIFSDDEKKVLNQYTQTYKLKTKDVSDLLSRKELERFVIELAWKSSRIEGNTYTLLETEKLIRFDEEARGHDKEESLMILNHKQAFAAICANTTIFKNIQVSKIEDIHKILVKDIGVKHNLRNTGVGISGSVYLPLDNQYQIREALEELCYSISKSHDPYTKALLALVGISYIQPFEDGNKRTARLIANAILIAHELCPLSYRDVDEDMYRQSMLMFYEINSIVPMKEIFLEQYKFSATNYFVGRFGV
jgi:fido (protein-threonine AMPylation protein)/predicted transcriptional regulator